MPGKSRYLHAGRAALAVVVMTLVALAGPRGLSAQDAALRGVVQDTSGAPVAGATVSVEGTRLSVVTGEDGRYRISGLSARLYSVSVERIGYSPARVSQDALSASTEAAPFTVTLVPSAVDLGAVTVIGSGRATAELREQLRDNPGSVAMIEPRDDSPFVQHEQPGDHPENGEGDTTEPRRGEHHRHEDEGGQGAIAEIGSEMHEGQGPVRGVTPPNRRSRRANSSMAARRAALSKSGQ